ncbi:hypothetical protein D1970_05880 [Mesobacillus zeae]|uniref:Uncharacterized protein n=1 Tax=Mesobacillus zeae TaxID=1917180 RepID=A0A398BB52_9BACI|nr:hypothetical protein D1970_05880 [Mesobacillus zeae]
MANTIGEQSYSGNVATNFFTELCKRFRNKSKIHKKMACEKIIYFFARKCKRFLGGSETHYQN